MIGASETRYDLRFQALRIPVRIHPFFWLVGAMMGWRDGDPNVVGNALIWVACVFVSILVHEYGHGLVARAFGSPASILLWAGGGLCFHQVDRDRPAQRAAVTLGGPGAGFVFCGVTMVVFSALYGMTPSEHVEFLKYWLWLPYDDDVLGRGLFKLPDTARHFYWFLVYINLWWGLVNLLPIWPLDGGNLSEVVLTRVNPYQGKRWAHVISLVLAGVLALLILAASQGRERFLPIFFGLFAFMNYQALQSIYEAQKMDIYDDDWWRR
jgi:Zn-dependent protease